MSIWVVAKNPQSISAKNIPLIKPIGLPGHRLVGRKLRRSPAFLSWQYQMGLGRNMRSSKSMQLPDVQYCLRNVGLGSLLIFAAAVALDLLNRMINRVPQPAGTFAMMCFSHSRLPKSSNQTNTLSINEPWSSTPLHLPTVNHFPKVDFAKTYLELDVFFLAELSLPQNRVPHSIHQ